MNLMARNKMQIVKHSEINTNIIQFIVYCNIIVNTARHNICTSLDKL